MFAIKPSSNVSFHTHPYEHMNYVIKGNAILVTENGENPVKEDNLCSVYPE